MIKKLFISVFLCFLVFISGQNLKVSEVKKIFSQPNFSEWSVPIPKENSIPLKWYPRNSSLKKDGIQPITILPLILAQKGIISFLLKMKKTKRAAWKTLFILIQKILN